MTDDEVFAAVQTLVARGEYRDQLLGLPGVALAGGGCFQESRDGLRRRVYERNSAEYVEAHAAGLIELLPPLEVAPAEAVAQAEARLGRPLPALLRRLYTQVGNGGFGPGYGVLGLDGGHTDDGGLTALSLRDRWNTLPPALLPICHWGCGIHSLVDLSAPDGSMWGWDPNPVPSEELASALFPQGLTFAAWLARWTAGALYQPALVQDAATGAWRGASDEEIRAWMADA